MPRIKDKSLPSFPKLYTIYRKNKQGKRELFWQVDPRQKNSNRDREAFKLKADAYRRVKEIAEEIKEEGRNARLTKEQLDEAAYCYNRLKPYKQSLKDAVENFIYNTMHENFEEDSRTVPKIADEWVVAKRDDKIDSQLSTKTIRDIEQTAERLKVLFPRSTVTQVQRVDIQNYIDSLKDLSQQTKSNRRNMIAQFFNYCRRKEYRKDNPADGKRIKIKVIRNETISTLTVDQTAKLMQEAEKEKSLLPFFALALFAGIRPEGELRRLTWEDITEERILIRKDVAKTGRWRRITPIPANLAQWLAKVPAKEKKGLVCPLRDGQFRGRYDKVRKNAGVKAVWDEDIMRHSFASYWIAIYHDREKLTEILGNSEKMLFDHYREFIEEAEAPKYWQILPAGEVVPSPESEPAAAIG